MGDLTKIDATIGRLEEQLRRARDDKLKLQHFIEMMERYSREGDEEDRTGSNGRRGSTAARIRELAHELIEGRRRATPLPEIVAHVDANGLEIEAKDKASYVSSILSRDDSLKNIRGTGWIILGATPIDPELRSEDVEKPDTLHAPEEKPDAMPSARPRLRPRTPSIADELDDDIPF